MREPQDALRAWNLPISIRPADDGLINRTYFVGPGPDAVLQWVNPIFSTAVQLDIHALTERLAAAGLETPHLIPTRTGALQLEESSGFWRAMTFIPGSTFHRLTSPDQAVAAGELLGRFHRALLDWKPQLQAPSRRIHDTVGHMRTLESALDACDGHALEAPARRLGRQILDAWRAWDGELEQPERMCHGDPKISNLRFDETGRRGVCMVDLDTIGPQTLSAEMGDAWRSWCNPAGEEDPAGCRFDLDLFAASAKGWRGALGELDEDELRSVVPGIERICLELAARFCADAVQNTYFREDRARFAEPGSHNLLKAEGQMNLARSALAHRERCERLLRQAEP